MRTSDKRHCLPAELLHSRGCMVTAQIFLPNLKESGTNKRPPRYLVRTRFDLCNSTGHANQLVDRFYDEPHHYQIAMQDESFDWFDSFIP